MLEKIIVEAFPNDKLWDIGISKEDPYIPNRKDSLGKNLQGGWILMRVRIQIKRLPIT